MQSRIWKRCSASVALLIRSCSPIPQRSSPGLGCAARNRGSIDLIPWRSPESQNAFEMVTPTSAPAPVTGSTAPWDELRAIAGPEHLRTGGIDDGIARVQPRAIFEPGSESELAAGL